MQRAHTSQDTGVPWARKLAKSSFTQSKASQAYLVLESFRPITQTQPFSNTGIPRLFPVSRVVVQSLSRVQLFATSWAVARQAPLSMGFPGQEYWSGLPFYFSRASSQPRDRPCVSCTGRLILYC